MRDVWASTVIVNPGPDKAWWSGRAPLSDEERKRWERARKAGGDILLPYQTGPHGPKRELSRFDTDWSATGPLIEKYRIGIMASHRGVHWGDWNARCWGGEDDQHWMLWGFCDKESEGDTPLVAVCNLLLALGEAGKL